MTKFIRLNPPPTPYVFSGTLQLRPVNGSGNDLLWTGNDDPQRVQCDALRALIYHSWFKLKLVQGNPKPPAIPISLDVSTMGVREYRKYHLEAVSRTPRQRHTYWLCRLPAGRYAIEDGRKLVPVGR
jgi:hypothetical protein